MLHVLHQHEIDQAVVGQDTGMGGGTARGAFEAWNERPDVSLERNLKIGQDFGVILYKSGMVGQWGGLAGGGGRFRCFFIFPK